MNTAKIGNRFQPTLVLVGTRLGIDKITPVYWEALISALQMPQSVGIAGYEFTIIACSRLIFIVTNHLSQRSPIIISLLHRCSRLIPLLPRSTPYKNSFTV